MKTLTLIFSLVLATPAFATGVSVTDVETLPVEQLEAAVASIDPATTDGQLAMAIASLRLGEHDKALLMFEALRGTAAQPRSDYYLGLLAELRGDFDEAQVFYARASEQYEDLDAQAYADNALLLLPMSRAVSGADSGRTGRSFLYTNAAIKSVDGLVDPDETVAIDEADTAFDLLLAGSLSLLDGDDWNVSLGGNFFNEAYSDFDDYDVRVLGAWLQGNVTAGEHRLRAQLGASTVQLGGEDYLSYVDLGLSDTLRLSDRWDLKLGVLLREVSADNVEFDYFAGDTRQLSAELKGRAGNPWEFAYTFRAEDRGFDTVTFENRLGFPLDGRLAYSRSFHQFAAGYEFAWSNGWEQSFRGTLRNIEYDDPNRFLDDETDLLLTERTRDGFRWSLESEVAIPVGNRLRLLGTLELFDEDSNIDQYDYSSTQFGLGFDYIF